MDFVRVTNSLKINRAIRLREQAKNCVTFAVRERDEGQAATLIDEAIRLARRSAELAKD